MPTYTLQRLLFLTFVLINFSAFSTSSKATFKCQKVLASMKLDEKSEEVIQELYNEEFERMKADISSLQESLNNEDKGLLARLMGLFRTPKKETQAQAEIKEIIKNQSDLESQREQELIDFQSDYRNSFLRKINKDTRWATHARDKIYYEQLKKLNAQTVVSLMIGSPGGKKIPSTEKKIRELVQSLTVNGVQVIYDADSQYAQLISEESGALGIGISAEAKKKKNLKNQKGRVFSIENCYMRRNIFQEIAEIKIASTDSPYGIGAIIENNHTVIFDSEKHLTDELKAQISSWESRLRAGPYHLGVRSPQLSGFSNISEFRNKILKKLKTFKQDPESSSTGSIADKLTHSEIAKTLDFADQMTKAEEMIAGPQGAVIFGSSRSEILIDQEVYDIAALQGELSIPVTTGGAGGQMKNANSGAKEAGGHSIGIPMGGASMLSTERTFARSDQTQTIPVNGFIQRIPLLAQNKELVQVVPGGMGTIREVSTVLGNMANPESTQQLIFIDTYYYQSIYNFILKLGLPEHIKKRIHLIELNDSALKELLDRLVEENSITGSNLFRVAD